MTVPPEVESLITNAPVSAHVATSVNDRPHVAPVWYGYRDGVLYFITGGTKLANARENPRVSLSIEEASDGDVAWNVTLLGTATVSDDPDRIDWASDWIYDKYEADDGTSAATQADESSSVGQDPETDGGEESKQEEYALIEVRVASAAYYTYDE